MLSARRAQRVGISRRHQRDWHWRRSLGRLIQYRLRRKNNPGSLEMAAWLKQKYAPTAAPNPEILWLDEVFADRQVSRRNNLVNFRSMVYGFSSRLDQTKVAYRTIVPAMTRVAMRDFGDDATIDKAKSDIPDWRNLYQLIYLGKK